MPKFNPRRISLEVSVPVNDVGAVINAISAHAPDWQFLAISSGGERMVLPTKANGHAAPAALKTKVVSRRPPRPRRKGQRYGRNPLLTWGNRPVHPLSAKLVDQVKTKLTKDKFTREELSSVLEALHSDRNVKSPKNSAAAQVTNWLDRGRLFIVQREQ